MDYDIKRFNSPALAYLSDERMRDIHAAALDILNDCGTVIHHKPPLALLRDAGAVVKDDKCVYIPGGLVERAIRSAPSRVTIYDCNGQPCMYLEGPNVYYGNGSDCPHLLDSFTGQRRFILICGRRRNGRCGNRHGRA